MAWTTPGTATAGEVLTAAFWNEQVRDNTDALYQSIRRLAYVTRTSDYTASTDSIATAADVFSSDLTITADGTSAYLFRLYIPSALVGSSAGSNIIISLVNGAGTDLGYIAVIGPASAVSPVYAEIYYTPAAGSQSFNIRARRSISNGFLEAGAGGSGTRFPMWFGIFGPVLT